MMVLALAMVAAGFALFGFGIGRHTGWTAGYRHRLEEEERERNAPTLEQIRAGVEASARLGY